MKSDTTPFGIPAAVLLAAESRSTWLKSVPQRVRHFLVLSATCAAALATLTPSLAQAPGDLRVALVIGNAAYAGAAALANPGNDAKAMSESLRSLGFTVVEVKDGSKAQMQDAISKVKTSLQGKQAIGMLYYAGHGLQLDWRNYMVPIDAKMSKAADVPEQTVDLAQVIDAFKSAGNRMNIVVLDACRDNPFAGTATGRGLAQLDAPPGTFLAYATAPGNVAEDGDAKSANGLYTKFLLEELKKPTSKIEDVFKRVRLNVRTESLGRQIPWESTSLEEDFFFRKLPGAQLSPEQAEKQFQTQLDRWNAIQSAKDLQALQAFLLDYPSGSFSELAQFRYDRLLKEQQRAQAEKLAQERLAAQQRIEQLAAQEQNRQQVLAQVAQEEQQRKLLAETQKILAAQQLVKTDRPNPNAKNSDAVALDRNFRVGASATYTEEKWSNKTTEELRYRVSKLNDDTVELNQGRVVWDLMGNVLSNRNGKFNAPRQFYPAELQVGKRWTTRVSREREDEADDTSDLKVRVTGRELKEVPAGKFETYVIKVEGVRKVGTYQRNVEWKIWVAPGIPFDIARERYVYNSGRLVENFNTKLTSWQP